MYENQKTILKGYLLWLFGFILSVFALAFIPIYANVLDKLLGDLPLYISFVLVFVGVFMIIHSSYFNIMLLSNFRSILPPRLMVKNAKLFIQGVPNNSYNEFSIGLNQILSMKEIKFKEIEKGIFIATLKDQIYKFDMRGWIRKKYYIYEYFLTLIQLQNEKCIYKKYQVKNTSTLKMLFIDKSGKKIEKRLIKDSYTQLSFLFKYRTRAKYRINALNRKKMAKSMRLYYDFN